MKTSKKSTGKTILNYLKLSATISLPLISMVPYFIKSEKSQRPAPVVAATGAFFILPHNVLKYSISGVIMNSPSFYVWRLIFINEEISKSPAPVVAATGAIFMH